MTATPRGIEFPLTTDPVRLAHYYQRLAETADAAIDAAETERESWHTALTGDSGQTGPGYAQLAAVTVPAVAGAVYAVTWEGRFRLAAGTGLVFAHIRSGSPLADRAVSALAASTTALTVSASAVVTASADGSLVIAAGFSTGGGTGNLVAGPAFPATLLVVRVK